MRKRQDPIGSGPGEGETEPALREFVAATWPEGTAPSVQPIFKTSIGDPATVILETAAHEAIDLIVMGTQGLGGFRKWLLGSTTERPLRRRTIGAGGTAQGQTGVPRENAIEIGHILAATDFSEASVAAVKLAPQLARRFSATLALTHVVEPLTVPPRWRSLVNESDETRIATARDRLKAVADESCGAQECELIVALGRPADVIGSIADDRRTQLIVMGLSSDQGPFSPRPGSIAYRVL